MIQKSVKKFFIFCSLSFYFYSNSQTVTTFAGSSNPGQTDGLGADATFYHPFGITTDANGNIYVADAYTYRIRKITPAGLVSTFAGSTQGYTDAIGTAAQFASPCGIAADINGNLYVADTENNCIRKINPNGVVTTLAGGTQGSADGIGTEAQFYHPAGVAVDVLGNVFVADKYNNRIRKITSNGVVTTFAGSGLLGAYFYYPFGVDVDNSGNVFVADTYNSRIIKINAAGVVTTLAGDGQGYNDGQGSSAKFYYPVDIEVDNTGNVFVADTENNRIRKIDPNGIVTTLAGSTLGFADGVGIDAKFSKPYGVAINTDGSVVVADLVNHRIRKILLNLNTINFELENQIIVYPNPTSAIIHLQIQHLTVVKVTLFDINQRAVQYERINNKSDINISNLIDGIYILQIITDKGVFNKKIVKN